MSASWESRMSPEDAVEIILLDNPFDVCPACNGGRWVANEPGTPMSLVSAGLLAHECTACRGVIASYKPEYVEACVVLGKDVPKMKAFLTIERLQRNPNYKPFSGKIVDIQPRPEVPAKMIRFPDWSKVAAMRVPTPPGMIRFTRDDRD